MLYHARTLEHVVSSCIKAGGRVIHMGSSVTAFKHAFTAGLLCNHAVSIELASHLSTGLLVLQLNLSWRQAQAGLGWTVLAHALHDCEADLVAASTIARRASAQTPHLHLGVHARDQNQRCVRPVGQSDKAVPSREKGHAQGSRRANFQHYWLAAAAPDCRSSSLAGACL
jgi:hypothetical protein